jgi:hypothetical protein
MSRLLNYAIFLASAVVIGFYIVFGPMGLGEIASIPIQRERTVIPATREAAVAHVEPASKVSIDEELDYMVAKRLGSLEGWRAFLAGHRNGAYALSAQAEVKRRLGANDASAETPVAAPASASTSDDLDLRVAQPLATPGAHAQSASAKVVQLLLAEKAPAPANVEVSNGPSSEVRAVNESTDRVASAFGDAVPAAAAAVVSNDAAPDAKTADEAARVAAPIEGRDAAAGTEIAALVPDEICKRDGDRLARLLSNPSSDEAQRFANELGCEKLRPQLQRIKESQGFIRPAPPARTNSSPSDSLLAGVCASQRAALDRLRKEPSAEDARRFWRDLKCERLRPQVGLLMESLNLTPDSPGSAAAPGEAERGGGAAFDAPTHNGADPVACRRETAELDRIRAAPDLADAKRFASMVTCDALKPQAARLLESLSE